MYIQVRIRIRIHKRIWRISPRSDSWRSFGILTLVVTTLVCSQLFVVDAITMPVSEKFEIIS